MPSVSAPGPRVELVVVTTMFAVCGVGIVASVLVTVKVTDGVGAGGERPVRLRRRGRR